MISPARIASPSNTHFHVRLELRVSRVRVPYVRPVIFITNGAGTRL